MLTREQAALLRAVGAGEAVYVAALQVAGLARHAYWDIDTGVPSVRVGVLQKYLTLRGHAALAEWDENQRGATGGGT